MIEYKERSEVAEDLRNHKKNSLDIEFECMLEECISSPGLICKEVRGDCVLCRNAILDRLAELVDTVPAQIKPVVEVRVKVEDLDKAVGQAFSEFFNVDRKSLLELADEMDSAAISLSEDSNLLVGAVGLIKCYSYSIRKALGVEEESCDCSKESTELQLTEKGTDKE